MSEEKKKVGEPGDVVQLADQETGFTDSESGFDISRDQKVALGDSVGVRTQQAILSGALLIVGGKATAKSDESQEEKPKGKK